jgi:hypothetical protein
MGCWVAICALNPLYWARSCLSLHLAFSWSHYLLLILCQGQGFESYIGQHQLCLTDWISPYDQLKGGPDRVGHCTKVRLCEELEDIVPHHLWRDPWKTKTGILHYTFRLGLVLISARMCYMVAWFIPWSYIIMYNRWMCILDRTQGNVSSSWKSSKMGTISTCPWRQGSS